MRLQQLECDSCIGGPEGDICSTHKRVQHQRQAFFESMWVGHRTGTLALRKTFTAWRCWAVLPQIQAEMLRHHGLERIQQSLDHCSRRLSANLLVGVLYSWVQVMYKGRYARDLRAQEAEHSELLNHQVVTRFNLPFPSSLSSNMSLQVSNTCCPGTLHSFDFWLICASPAPNMTDFWWVLGRCKANLNDEYNDFTCSPRCNAGATLWEGEIASELHYLRSSRNFFPEAWRICLQIGEV